jgi:hypothetical protein
MLFAMRDLRDWDILVPEISSLKAALAAATEEQQALSENHQSLCCNGSVGIRTLSIAIRPCCAAYPLYLTCEMMPMLMLVQNISVFPWKLIVSSLSQV